MAGANRVAWREGLFLRPQHFQQQDRFVESLVHARTSAISPYAWGLSEVVVNESLAQLGKFAIERCAGFLPDGASVAIPEGSPPPPPINVPSDTRDAIVYLTLPAGQPGAIEYQFSETAGSSVRNLVSEEDVYDAYAEERQSERIELARPNLNFGIAREQTDGRVVIALAKIREVLNGRLIFDETFIPSLLDIRASRRLSGFLTDILGRADQRVDELSLRAVEASDGGSETFAAFLILMLLNRWTPVLTHLRNMPMVHPERLFETFCAMAGELATLTRPDRRAPPFPPYDHLDLQATFEPVFELLQAELSAQIDRSAGQLTLEAVGPGAYTALIEDHAIFQTCSFFLAASARVRGEDLRSRFGSVVKVGSVLKMRDIVSSSLQAGVRISPVPTPPPQIRILPGFVYFELDRASPDWRDLASAPSIGLHVAGDWPELKLELWWVKRAQR